MKNSEYVIGLDLGGTNIRGGAVTKAGVITASATCKTEVSSGYPAILAKLQGLVEELAHANGSKPLAVGLGSAGAIDATQGVISSSPNFPDWKNVPLEADLAQRLGVDVALENDGAVAAYGEGWTGAAQGVAHFVALTLGTGVGGGVILHNRIWRGTTGAAGEIGHLRREKGGRLCGCGATGCLERYASATGIKISARERYDAPEAAWLRKATNGDPQKVGGRLLQEGAEGGDPFCRELYADVGDALGQAMGTMALLLDIHHFLLGGGLSAAHALIIPAARQSALATAYTLTDDKLTIRPASLGANAGVIGAARLAFDR